MKNKTKFAGWLAVICRNVALDLAHNREILQSTEDLSMIAAESHENDVTEAVKEVLNKLSAIRFSGLK